MVCIQSEELGAVFHEARATGTLWHTVPMEDMSCTYSHKKNSIIISAHHTHHVYSTAAGKVNLDFQLFLHRTATLSLTK